MSKKGEESISKVIQLVNFRLREEEFGVDINSVREVTKVTGITHIPEAPSFIRGVANLRGQVMAVIDLAKRFDLAPYEELPESVRIVVTEVKGQALGLLVDEVPGILKISEENIEPTPDLIQTEVKKDHIQGVARSEKKLIILLDLEKLLSIPELEELAQVSEPTTEE